MNYHLPTFEECVEICEKNDAFIHKVEEVWGYTVHVFSYGLASYGDFLKPLEDSDVRAFELRGITFVEGGDRFLMLSKFFGLGQTDNWHYEDIKDKKIRGCQDKLDGSMCRFIRLPDGSVVAKTKMGFTNEQALMANKIYENNNRLRDFVDFSLDMKEAAIFELVSPFNRIVVRYRNTELKLLQIRDEKTGYYKLHHKLKQYGEDFGILVVGEEKILPLDDYIGLQKKVTDKEGWVITFEDGQLLKIKTQWYLDLHHLLTEDLSREDYIIHATLNETIDDAIANLDKDDPMRDYITEISKKVVDYYNGIKKELLKLIYAYDGDRKKFAIANKEHGYFSVMMLMINRDLDGIDEVLKESIMKKTRRLDMARKFLHDEIGVDLEKIKEE